MEKKKSNLYFYFAATHEGKMNLKRVDNYVTTKLRLDKPSQKVSFGKYLEEHWKIWASVYILNLIDAILTLWALGLQGGQLYELNKLMGMLLPHPLIFIGFKMVMVTVLLIFGYIFLSRYPTVHHIMSIYLFMFFFLIDINNVLHITNFYGLTDVNLVWSDTILKRIFWVG